MGSTVGFGLVGGYCSPSSTAAPWPSPFGIYTPCVIEGAAVPAAYLIAAAVLARPGGAAGGAPSGCAPPAPLVRGRSGASLAAAGAALLLAACARAVAPVELATRAPYDYAAAAAGALALCVAGRAAIRARGGRSGGGYTPLGLRLLRVSTLLAALVASCEAWMLSASGIPTPGQGAAAALTAAAAALLAASTPRPSDLRDPPHPLLPDDCPEPAAGLLATLTFSWMNPLIERGVDRALAAEDVWRLPPDDRVTSLSATFDRHWAREVKRAAEGEGAGTGEGAGGARGRAGGAGPPPPAPPATAGTGEGGAASSGADRPSATSLLRACARSVAPLFVFALPAKLVVDASQFAPPFFISALLTNASAAEAGRPGALWTGTLYGAAMFVALSVGTFADNMQFQLVMRAGFRLRSVLTQRVCAKILYLTPDARSRFFSGRLYSAVGTDVDQIQMLCQSILGFISAPTRIVVSVTLLYRVLGPAAFGAVALLVAVMPLQAALVRAQRATLKAALVRTDERAKLEGELLAGVEVVKCSAWEESFLRRVASVRGSEVSLLRRAAALGSINIALMLAVPVLSAVGTFAAYGIITGRSPTASQAFTSLALLAVMRFPLFQLPQLLASSVAAAVALERLAQLLRAPERPAMPPLPAAQPPAAGDADRSASPDGGLALSVRGDFAWSLGDDAALAGVRLDVRPGQLVAVVGATGSGKSSLLSASLGMMELVGEGGGVEGGVLLRGRAAYVPQTAFITNATIRDNITFGASAAARDGADGAASGSRAGSATPSPDFDADLYRRAIRAACLGPDLASQPAGDLTELGERGVTVSGGQKQRIALARAVYSRPDVVLLDDPLSALDARVGRRVFARCVRGELARAARILVTNQLQYVRHADRVLYIEGGRIVEDGTYDELLGHGGAFARMMAASSAEEESDDEVDGADADDGLDDDDDGGDGKQAPAPEGGTPDGDARRPRSRATDAFLEDRDEEGEGERAEGDGLARANGSDVPPPTLPGGPSPRVPPPPASPSEGAAAPGPRRRRGGLVSAEERSTGRVSRQVIAAYCVALGGAAAVTALGLVFFSVESFRVAAQLWLQHWTNVVGSSVGALGPARARGGLPGAAPAGPPAGSPAPLDLLGAVGWMQEAQASHLGLSAGFPGGWPSGAGAARNGSSLAAAATRALLALGPRGWEGAPGAPAALGEGALGVADAPPSPPPPGPTYFLAIYAALSGLQVAATAIAQFGLRSWSLRAAERLHGAMLARLTGAKMSFFHTTPHGRMMNRLTRDTTDIDRSLPDFASFYANALLQLVSGVLLVTYLSPGTLAALLPSSLAFAYLYRRFQASVRELKRLDALTRSPVYSAVGEAISGIATLRAYRAEGALEARAAASLDANVVMSLANQSCNRWLSVRMETLGAALASASAVATVLARAGPSLAGNVLTTSLQFSMLVGMTLRSASVAETAFNAVERVLEYGTKPELEDDAAQARLTRAAVGEDMSRTIARWGAARGAGRAAAAGGELSAPLLDLDEADAEAGAARGAAAASLAAAPGSPARAPAGWPWQGEVSFEEVRMRYRPELPLVLKGLSVTIPGGSSCGVVGRTGAGKSSLVATLFRLVPLAGGRVLIDGVDTTSLPLRALRSSMALIPQAPVLFTGTVRFNLDPFGARDDSELWTALRRAHLRDAIAAYPLGLDLEITEGGAPLSAGQRQLLALARALLVGARVLVLDEATASVDVETDARIQETVRSEFRECTVIAVAHRLHTVVDTNNVLVMSDGRAVEFGRPHDLLTDRSSAFSSMVAETGEATERVLRRMAARAAGVGGLSTSSAVAGLVTLGGDADGEAGGARRPAAPAAAPAASAGPPPSAPRPDEPAARRHSFTSSDGIGSPWATSPRAPSHPAGSQPAPLAASPTPAALSRQLKSSADRAAERARRALERLEARPGLAGDAEAAAVVASLRSSLDLVEDVSCLADRAESVLRRAPPSGSPTSLAHDSCTPAAADDADVPSRR